MRRCAHRRLLESPRQNRSTRERLCIRFLQSPNVLVHGLERTELDFDVSLDIAVAR